MPHTPMANKNWNGIETCLKIKIPYDLKVNISNKLLEPLLTEPQNVPLRHARKVHRAVMSELTSQILLGNEFSTV